LDGPVAVVRGLGVQLVRLEPVGDIIVDDRIEYHHTISTGGSTEADE
jgi:hypothetical protein